jgi:hypothetical protein
MPLTDCNSPPAKDLTCRAVYKIKWADSEGLLDRKTGIPKTMLTVRQI